VTSQDSDPAREVPEADLLEQLAPVEPATGPDPEATVEGTSDWRATRADAADEADQLEQLDAVPTEDDESYPREP
jgi:hypothetical protein